jgi:hypothetical protein
MTNLFPLPYWAPALQRVPTPFRILNEAFIFGERSLQGARVHDGDAGEHPGLADLGKRKCRSAHPLWDALRAARAGRCSDA